MSDIPAPITPSVDTQRRRLLQATAAGIALGTLAPPVFATTDAASTVAATRAGRVRGLREQGVHAFKGIRYGADTTGARFQRPRAPRAWSGVADATAATAGPSPALANLPWASVTQASKASRLTASIVIGMKP